MDNKNKKTQPIYDVSPLEKLIKTQMELDLITKYRKLLYQYR